MTEHRSPIPSMIYNAAVGGHVTNSQQIIDENLNKEQSQINAEIKQTFANLADNAKVKALEDKVDSLTTQLAEAIALLKSGTIKQKD